jgi:signal transduction histidine kinase
MNELIPHLDGTPSHPSPNGAAGERRDGKGSADLRGALRRVTHDINNPLSIISGNAQLLLELSRALDLDPDVAKPIQDIEEASQRLAAMVERLNALNDAAREGGAGGA